LKEHRLVDDSGKDVSKSVVINTFLKYSNKVIESDDNHLTQVSTQKSPNCEFRLLNVLFDDEYAEAFLATSASMSRVELDALSGALEVSFWEVIAEAYKIKENFRFDVLLFDREHFCSRGIYPSLYVNHTAAKLREIWRNRYKNYNKPRRKYQ
jgi:hypothetical protein